MDAHFLHNQAFIFISYFFAVKFNSAQSKQLMFKIESFQAYHMYKNIRKKMRENSMGSDCIIINHLFPQSSHLIKQLKIVREERKKKSVQKKARIQ